MAKAQKITRKIRTVVEKPGFTLELSEGDADFLVSLLSRVRGNRTSSPRKYADRIKHALMNAGVDREFDAIKLSHGSVWFEDYKDPKAGLPRISFGYEPLPAPISMDGDGVFEYVDGELRWRNLRGPKG